MNKDIKYPEKEEKNVDYAKESLRLHEEWKGKIEVISRVPVASKEDYPLLIHRGWRSPVWKFKRMWKKVMI